MMKEQNTEHMLTFAPLRSGKGVGLVIPNLPLLKQSALIIDVKNEVIAEWQQKYGENKMIRFEPAAEKGHVLWNPLAEIRIGTPYEIEDAQNLAALMVDPDGKGLEDYWQKTTQALLVDLILKAIQKEGSNATFTTIDTLLHELKNRIDECWNNVPYTQNNEVSNKEI